MHFENNITSHLEGHLQGMGYVSNIFNWFLYHFVHEALCYCTYKNLHFEILLLLDNVPDHPAAPVVDVYLNITLHCISNPKYIFESTNGLGSD